MPELPEVETIVSDLRKILPGKRFLRLNGVHKNSVEGALKNEGLIRGCVVSVVERRGKFMNIFFGSAGVMTLHLRMSGRIVVQEHEDAALPYERTRIDFEGVSLRFCDIRKFGRVWINGVSDFEEKTGISRLGVEPLGGELDFARFVGIFGKKKGLVKRWLLDQSLIAGIGNIYADEACFYAGVRPGAAIEKLGEAELRKLFESVIKALEQGIRNRGTSISDFVDAYGKGGKNQEVLFVYGRGGKDCLVCKEKLVKLKLAGRGTVYCPGCQK